MRLIPITAATHDLNAKVGTILGDTVWRYYELVSSQWPTDANGSDATKPSAGSNWCTALNPVDQTGKPAPAFLANTTLETYIQGTVPQASSSCTHCHLNATMAEGQNNFSDFTYLLERAQFDPGSTPASEARAATARSVMRLWYLGYWYPIEAGAFESVVSDQAYIRGLAWQVMQSHAMGYSPWTYGYWANRPPPLTDFTGNPEPPEPPASGAAEPPLGRARTALTALSALGQGKGGRSPADFAEAAGAGTGADEEGGS